MRRKEGRKEGKKEVKKEGRKNNYDTDEKIMECSVKIIRKKYKKNEDTNMREK